MHYGHIFDYTCEHCSYTCNHCDKFAPILFIVKGLFRKNA